MEEISIKIESIVKIYKDKLSTETYNSIMTQAMLEAKQEEIQLLKKQLDEVRKELATEVSNKQSLEREVAQLKGKLEFYEKGANE